MGCGPVSGPRSLKQSTNRSATISHGRQTRRVVSPLCYRTCGTARNRAPSQTLGPDGPSERHRQPRSQRLCRDPRLAGGGTSAAASKITIRNGCRGRIRYLASVGVSGAGWHVMAISRAVGRSPGGPGPCRPQVPPARPRRTGRRDRSRPVTPRPRSPRGR